MKKSDILEMLGFFTCQKEPDVCLLRLHWDDMCILVRISLTVHYC